jgi:hypothetical protein
VTDNEMRGRTLLVGKVQLAWHYDPAFEPQWGFRNLPGIRWRRGVMLGRLVAWVGAR